MSGKLLFTTLAIALSLLTFNSPSKAAQKVTTPSNNLQDNAKMDTAWADTSKVFKVVEKMPTFRGGFKNLLKYLSTNIRYPEEAKEANIQGKVYMNFIIEKDGSISHLKVVKGIGYGCDKQAVNTIKNMPPWIPGEKGGKPVRVSFNLPVKFSMDGAKTVTATADTSVYVIAEKKPTFPGGEEKFWNYLATSIKYPEEAKIANIQGKVYVNFIIEKDGSISHVKVLKGIGHGCDKEAVNAVKNMPRWIPGEKGGKPVRVNFSLPFNFSMAVPKTDTTQADTTKVFRYKDVKKKPTFPGGEEKFKNYLLTSIKYPEEAKKANIQGNVYVNLIIEKDGSISHVKVVKGIGHGCDQEAVKVVENMPRWIPGKQRRKPVRVSFILPFNFSIDNVKTNSTQADTSKVFMVVEKMPTFPGGFSKLMKYLNTNIKFPEEARKAKIQGRVFINFIIENDGSVSHVKVLKGIGYGCDKEAVKVIENMPRWIAGTQGGKPVRVSFNLPVNFSLDVAKTDTARADTAVYLVVEKMPSYPGGFSKLMTYLATNIRYPAEARKAKIQGRVIVNFTIENDGNVSHVKVLKGIGYGCDKEAVKVIKNMSRWIPGTQKGKPVRVSFNLPIQFTLPYK